MHDLNGGFIQTLQPTSGFVLTKKDGEFLRVIASVSVVAAHCMHHWVELFCSSRNWLSLDFVSTLLDQATRFTVPLFFFLSGFGLTLQFQGKKIDLKRYYKFRLIKILAPFLVFSLLSALRHLEYFESLPWSQDLGGTLKIFSRFLFLDGFDYQFYFVIVIFQFYCLYPLLYKLGQSKFWMGLFLILHMGLLSPVETYLTLFGLELPKIHPNLIVFHWFYCFAGIYAAWNKDFLIQTISNWSKTKVMVFWLAAFAVLNIEFQVNILNEKFLGDADHFNRWAVLIYCISSLLVFMKVKDWIAKKVYEKENFNFLFTMMAPYTFFVYLIHTHVLRVVDYLLWEVSVYDFLNRIILVVAGSYLVAWSLQWLLEDFPKLRFYLGLPNHPIKDWSSLPGLSRFKLKSKQFRSQQKIESVARKSEYSDAV